MRAAQNHRLEHTRQSEIIRVETAAGNVTGTFLAARATADELSHSSFLLPRPLRLQRSARSQCTYKGCRPVLCESLHRMDRNCAAKEHGSSLPFPGCSKHIEKRSALRDVPCFANLFIGWIGIALQKSMARHYHSRRAVTALKSVVLDERFLYRV